jgi:NADPH2:quinone reductase
VTDDRVAPAQEYVVVPARHAMPLPDNASFELGEHRHPRRDGPPGADRARGRTGSPHVEQSGRPDRARRRGAGAVGHATIQLARRAGARVIATVSTDRKAKLSLAAGAEAVVRHRSPAAAQDIRAFAPDGVDVIVEVAPAANARLNAAVIASHGCVAV